MAHFSSILFTHPDIGGHVDSAPAPDCFPDLHLDRIVSTIVHGAADELLDQLFYLPLHDVDAVGYRHEVFADLSRDEVRGPIDTFVSGMHTMRVRRTQEAKLRNPLQKQGWFVYAVAAFSATVTRVNDELTRVDLMSRGLRDLADYVAGYVGSGAFAALVADTDAIQAELHEIRYTVHITGLRVHVDKWNGQSDYSADIAETFERFRAEPANDYHVRLNEFADMDHVEEQILACVAKLYPEVFARLADYCTRHSRYLDPIIGRFDREIGFYLAYLNFVGSFTRDGMRFSYPTVTTEPGVLSAEDAFDLALAIKSSRGDTPLVRNDFRLGGSERIIVVTGPNQGGKTTFAPTIGQCAFLAALGCPVPARHARLTLSDRIYTHFERQETLSTLRGKLDDELVRIHHVPSEATPPA